MGEWIEKLKNSKQDLSDPTIKKILRLWKKAYDKLPDTGVGVIQLQNKHKIELPALGKVPVEQISFADKMHRELEQLGGLERIDQDEQLQGTKKKKKSVYDVLNERILRLMKKDGLFWRKPWVAPGREAGMPELRATNYVSKKPYQGINWLILNMGAILEDGHDNPYFMTPNQIKKYKGAHIKKGAKPYPVFYYSMVCYLAPEGVNVWEVLQNTPSTTPFNEIVKKWEKLDVEACKKFHQLLTKITDKEQRERQENRLLELPFLKYYEVFNGEEIGGIDFKFKTLGEKETPDIQNEPIPAPQQIVDEFPNRPPTFFKRQNRAFYEPTADRITLPMPGQFESSARFYSTLIHEYVHSTKHEKRINDKTRGRKPGQSGAAEKKSYAFEELIAELGAVYLCHEAKIDFYTLDNSAAYLQSWLSVLTDLVNKDDKFFARAAGKANTATDYIRHREKYAYLKANTKKLQIPWPEGKKSDPAARVEAHADDIDKELARRAFYWTSFFPEKRGEQFRQDYAQSVNEAYTETRQRVEKLMGNKEQLDVQAFDQAFQRWQDRTLKAAKEYLSAHSRVASSAITGPANFPVESNRKKSNRADRLLQEYLNQFNIQLDRLAHKFLPEHLRPIISGEREAITKLEAKLRSEEQHHELMVQINKALREARRKKLTYKETLAFLKERGVADKMAVELLKPDFAGRTGFKGFELSNSSARIRKLKERINYEKRELAKREKAKEKGPELIPATDEHPEIQVVENAEANRLQLIFEGKPPEGLRQKLKKNGFRWSPRFGAWQRQLTNNARQAVTRMFTAADLELAGILNGLPLNGGGAAALEDPDSGLVDTTEIPGLFTPASGQVKPKGETLRLPGAIGEFLGEQQLYKNAMAIHGMYGSGKSEFVMQLADALAACGKTIGFFDLERGGLQSRDTQASVGRNITPAHKPQIHFAAEAPAGLDSLKRAAEYFDVVICDSWQKLGQHTNELFDELRQQHPQTLWVVIFQENARGETRGGQGANFDANVVLRLYRPNPHTFRDNYVVALKNRGNRTDQIYMIQDKEVATEPKEHGVTE
jgi:antirestriction protein ArdC